MDKERLELPTEELLIEAPGQAAVVVMSAFYLASLVEDRPLLQKIAGGAITAATWILVFKVGPRMLRGGQITS